MVSLPRIHPIDIPTQCRLSIFTHLAAIVPNLSGKLSGKNPSAVRVDQASKMTDKPPTLFGMVMMADDPLNETLDPKSKPMGRAQGALWVS
ncbi:hypothetical protein EZV62_005998 [Acer yangbiense]|uniref:Dirigent protein n=1 Tax=Acer yangbiense TaxID=1000413 RepID=A0A5C7INY2_9ROSI|nr:hypothetical protein EZV62_005998 [Acer yangbiense]